MASRSYPLPVGLSVDAVYYSLCKLPKKALRPKRDIALNPGRASLGGDFNETAIDVEHAGVHSISMPFAHSRSMKNPPHTLHQREALRHIVGADDEVQLERVLVCKLFNHNNEIEDTPLLDVLDLMLGRDDGVNFEAEGVGEEYDVVALW
jgi:hypothetical protein